jgi:N-acetylglucosaminyl-diphospho-decaprenol L-rhamnosyltransferase
VPVTPDGDPRVSVVIITRNRRDELDRTLRHLAALPEAPPVVVVDNGSTDGTAALVRGEHPHVDLVQLPCNAGAAGRNAGVARVTTDHVAFCDDDTWYEPGALSAAADVLDAHPSLAVVTARIIVEPSGRTDAISEEMGRSPLWQPAGLPGYPLLSFLAGVSVVRRRALLEVGGFPERFFIGGEEEIVASNLARRGWLMTYVPEVVAHHAPSHAREWHERRRLGIRNTLWFAWLRRPAWPALRRTVAMARAVPKDRISLHGFLDAVRGLPWVLREREVVPRQVEAGYRLLDRSQLRGRARRYVS